MGEKLRILIIDDDPHVVDALKVIVDDNGYEGVTALTGREALRRAGAERFRVAVVDLRLPDMSGFDVLSRIRESDPHTAIIVITSYATPEVVARSRDLGGFAVLPKPFSPSDILNLISKAFSGS